jgi:hypothetical protein
MFKRFATAAVVAVWLHASSAIPIIATAPAAQLDIYAVKVPAAVMGYSGMTGGLYQIWISGGAVDTIAFSVFVKYTFNGSTFTSTAISPNSGGVGSYYNAVALVPLPSPEAVVVSVLVEQLKAFDSKAFTVSN